MKAMQRYIVAGLLVWVPLGVTFLILRLTVNLLDETLVLIPAAYRPENLLGFRIPGLGILLTAAVILLTGVVAANFFGSRLLAFAESILDRIPFVRSIYGGAKNFAEVVLGDSGQSFKKVVLVEYPRKGIFSIGFITGTELAEVQARTDSQVICVFVPTTPNPTSGFIILVPREEVIELDMSVEAAIKMVVSLGVVVPKWTAPPRPSELAKLKAAP